MTTLRFSMTTLASRALNVEAVMRSLTDCFGHNSDTSSIGKQRKSCDVKLSEQVAHLRNQVVNLKEQFLLSLLPEASKQCGYVTDRLLQSANLYAPEKQEQNISCDISEMDKLRNCMESISEVIEEINHQCLSVDCLSDEALVLRAYANMLPMYIRKMQYYRSMLAMC